MVFNYAQKVLFKHCDPAGIVFYPRYFEMINDVTEAFFDTELKYSFLKIHEHNGVPTAQIEAKFSAPTRLGDDLNITLICNHIGRSSLGLTFEASCHQEKRFQASSTIVFVDSSGKPASWPSSLRGALQSHLSGDS